ncbi:MAG: family 16 glycoside hydrolase [Planctomycetota bacterium]
MSGAHRTLALAAILLGLALPLAAQSTVDEEARSYRLEEIPNPPGALLEVGGLDFLSDGRLVVSTRRGQVWIATGVLGNDLSKVNWSLFAEGLQDCLGLRVVDDRIYVVQRAELTELEDRDRDGRCDGFRCVTDGWGVSGNYHEFAFGLPTDDEGNFYVSLNVAFWGATWWLGRSPVPYRGWVLRVSPKGEVTPVASGFRSPCGVARNSAGDIFVTDNQGDWLPACPIHHVVDGAFYGHPASLDWREDFRAAGRHASDTFPPDIPRKRAACWIPYSWSRSTGNLQADRTGGKFGPFEEQLFVAELTNGYLLRADLEKVRGEYQGAILKFHSKVGSAVRTRFAPDGSLFVGRTARGWGGQAPNDGVCRLRPTGRTPVEMQKISLTDTGFKITFTQPIDPATLPAPEAIEATEYDYNYWWRYGSPEQRARRLEVFGTDLSEGGRQLIVGLRGLQAGKVVRLRIPGVKTPDGSVLVHDEFAYTINQLRTGPVFEGNVAKKVAPPRQMENSNEGRIMCANGRALDSFVDPRGWRLGDVEPDGAKGKKEFVFKEVDPGDRDPSSLVLDLTNAGATDVAPLETRYHFGDCAGTIWFRLPAGGKARFFLQGRYGITLADQAPVPGGDPRATMGAILPGADWTAPLPALNGNRGADNWHWVSYYFDAPRFDAAGNKVADARLKRLLMNDVLLYENVRLPGPSADAPYRDEVAEGPLVLLGDLGPVAYRSIDIQRENVVPDEEGWTRIFDGKTLDGWRASEKGDWKVEDGVIVGRGNRSHLFSPRGDYRDFEVRGWFKINDKGNSGLYVRAAYGEGWPEGYEAQINSTFSDPVKTGSLYHHAFVKATLVPPGVWFKYQVRIREVDGGTRIQIRVNDVLTTDFVDTERKHASGHVAIQQHDPGGEVRIRDLEVRERR